MILTVNVEEEVVLLLLGDIFFTSFFFSLVRKLNGLEFPSPFIVRGLVLY